MATLTIDDKTARKIYPSAIPELKAILDDSFPANFFSQKITDRIKTFEDACEALNIDEEADCFTEGDPDEIAYKKLKIIARALNEGWKPNWKNSQEYKWSPWFYMDSPGFRFSDSFCSNSDSFTAGGSRLCFKSEELANYAGKQFLKLYETWLA